MNKYVFGRKACVVALSLAPVLLAPSPAGASSADWGYISGVYATSNGAILFNTSGTRTATPACQSSSVPQRFAIDASTTAGQAAASLLITAYTLHRQVIVAGMGSCSIWPDTETVSVFQVSDS